ncbi:hypothetical protein F7O00_04985 [Campylobacter coli]|nr:hypothetical protein [Campylobacter coli]
MYRSEPTYHNIYGFKTIDLIEKILPYTANKVINYSIGKMIEYALETDCVDQPIRHLEMIEWHTKRIQSIKVEKENNDITLDLSLFSELDKIKSMHKYMYWLVVNIIKYGYDPNEENFSEIKNYTRIVKGSYING